jgi:hypothetical protein
MFLSAGEAAEGLQLRCKLLKCLLGALTLGDPPPEGGLRRLLGARVSTDCRPLAAIATQGDVQNRWPCRAKPRRGQGKPAAEACTLDCGQPTAPLHFFCSAALPEAGSGGGAACHQARMLVLISAALTPRSPR